MLIKFSEFAMMFMAALLLTQVMIPVIIDKPIFWLFRSKNKLDAKRAQLEQRKIDAEKELQLAKLEAETARLEVKAEIAKHSILDEEIEEEIFDRKEETRKG